MSPPPRTGFPSRAGVAAAALAALLAPAVAGAQLPGPPAPGVKLAPADSAAGDLFACALAIDGDRAVAGSVLDDDLGSASGSLYLFSRNGNGGWGQTKVLASDGAAGDQLGFAVGISGDRVAAGAPFRDQVGDTSGAVYVFTRRPDGGFAEARLVPPGLGARDEVGRSVAVSGTTVAAGAPGDDDRGSSAGAVFVWEVDPESGAPLGVAKLTAGDGAAGDGFGYSVALAGGTLLVGAPYDDDGGAQAGSVYVFERQGAGWSQAAKLTASDRAPGSLFGWSIAVSAAGRAAIGARLDRGAGAAAGAVYVFEAAGGWHQTAKLLPPGLPPGEELGVSVALDGDAVIAGARFGAAGGQARAGAGYLFVLGPDGWEARNRLIAPAPGGGDELGYAVGIAGGTVFAGAYRDDDAGHDSGTICVFDDLPVNGGRTADLAISKTDGRIDIRRDQQLTYTIEVENLGPDDVEGATVSDVFPSELSGCNWSCSPSASCGSGGGPIADTVSLDAGAKVTYSATCTASADPVATVTNTARVDPPADVEDPNLGNNEATDVTLIVGGPTQAPADLEITKSNGSEPVVAGETTAYTIVASNLGPNPATARVQDGFPPALGDCEWSCVTDDGTSCGSGSGAIDSTATLLPNESLTFTTDPCLLDPAAQETLTNAATVAVVGPFGTFDPDLSNNSATDSDPIVREADLEVTKTVAGPAPSETIVLGGPIEFKIVVENLGPSAAAGSRLLDLLPEELESCSWSCSDAGGAECGAGTSDPDQDVEELDEPIPTLPPGGSVTFVVPCTVSPNGEPGTFENLATVTPPAGVVDPDPDNDSATVVFTVVIPPTFADLSITKSDNQTQVIEGEPLIYSITVSNAGPDDAEDVRVVDLEPANLAFQSWSCGTLGGSGDLDVELDLPAGSSVSCTVTAASAPGFCGDLVNVATVDPPQGVVDPDFADRTAADTTRVFPPAAMGPTFNLCASKALLTGPHAPGSTVIYQVLLFNGGPAPLLDDLLEPEFQDPVPSEVTVLAFDADAGMPSPPGNFLTWDGSVPPGGVVTLTISGVVNGPVGQAVSNQGFFVQVETDDPATPAPLDPTVFVIAGPLEIPALGAVGLAALAALLAAAAVRRLRRGGWSRAERRR